MSASVALANIGLRSNIQRHGRGSYKCQAAEVLCVSYKEESEISSITSKEHLCCHKTNNLDARGPALEIISGDGNRNYVSNNHKLSDI